MAARSIQIKDFSAEEFAERLRRYCRRNDGIVDLSRKGLTNESLARRAEALLKAFGPSDDANDDDDDSSLTLKNLLLGDNLFGGDGLGALAEALSGLPRCRETLGELDIRSNEKVTTLAPLAKVGVLEGLKALYADECSLSGDSNVLPPELCANLPALEVLNLSSNQGGATITLTAEALCLLPAECQVVLHNSRVQVARPSAEEGEMGLVALPTAPEEEFGGYSCAKTVKEICAFAGVQRMTLVKPARTRSPNKSRNNSTGMRRGTCYSPRPQYACAGCKAEAYCDAHCQRTDWQSHQRVCSDDQK